LPRELQEAVVGAGFVVAVIRQIREFPGDTVGGGNLLCAALAHCTHPPVDVVAVGQTGAVRIGFPGQPAFIVPCIGGVEKNVGVPGLFGDLLLNYAAGGVVLVVIIEAGIVSKEDLPEPARRVGGTEHVVGVVLELPVRSLVVDTVRYVAFALPRQAAIVVVGISGVLVFRVGALKHLVGTIIGIGNGSTFRSGCANHVEAAVLEGAGLCAFRAGQRDVVHVVETVVCVRRYKIRTPGGIGFGDDGEVSEGIGGGGLPFSGGIRDGGLVPCICGSSDAAVGYGDRESAAAAVVGIGGPPRSAGRRVAVGIQRYEFRTAPRSGCDSIIRTG